MNAREVDISRRAVLVLAPRGRDGSLVVSSLREIGIAAQRCESMRDLGAKLGDEVGAVVVSYEALGPAEQHQLLQHLARQPAWSAVPVVILTLPSPGVDALGAFLSALGPVGTAIVVERPIKPATLQSILRMALLARQRQHQMREHLEQIEAQKRELARHRDNLRSLVEERTGELSVSIRKAQDAERLAALGNMAAGIGHDIANMTLPIRARLEPLGASISNPEAHEDIVAIARSLDHLSNLSAGLRLMALDPSRDTASAPAGDLHAWRDHADAILRNALPRGVQFQWDMPAPPLGVSMASHRLTQAVFNLVQNAGEALSASGARNGAVRVSIIARPGAGAGWVEVRVSDNGPGIAPEHAERIFEPYFTTKGRAIATGMGLGMVRGLIESCGGTVRVESEFGKGATFILTLPARAQSGDASSHGGSGRRSAAVSLPNGSQRALVQAILEGLSVRTIDHAPTGGSGAPAADIWIAADPAPGALVTFMDGGGRLVLVSEVSAELERTAARWNGRVVRVGPGANAGAVRDALVAAVRGLKQPDARAGS